MKRSFAARRRAPVEIVIANARLGLRVYIGTSIHQKPDHFNVSLSRESMVQRRFHRLLTPTIHVCTMGEQQPGAFRLVDEAEPRQNCHTIFVGLRVWVQFGGISNSLLSKVNTL